MISVVVPVYNEEATVENTICNITAALQNLDDVEIIVVNDGSTDDTLKIIKSMESEHLKIIHHIENLGYGKSLWDGIKKTRHDCIAIIVVTVDFWLASCCSQANGWHKQKF